MFFLKVSLPQKSTKLHILTFSPIILKQPSIVTGLVLEPQLKQIDVFTLWGQQNKFHAKNILITVNSEKNKNLCYW